MPLWFPTQMQPVFSLHGVLPHVQVKSGHSKLTSWVVNEKKCVSRTRPEKLTWAVHENTHAITKCPGGRLKMRFYYLSVSVSSLTHLEQ